MTEEELEKKAEERIKAKAKEQFPNDEFKQQIVIDAINCITKKLQEENKYLKEALECAEHNCKVKQEYNDNQFNAIMKYRKKAKELIKNIVKVTWGEGWSYSLDWKVKAEKFLKEEE